MAAPLLTVAHVLSALARRPHAVFTVLALVSLAVWVFAATPELWNTVHQWLHDLVMHGAMHYRMRPIATTVAFLLVFTVVSVVSIPGGSILAVGAGAVFGAIPATVCITVASTLGASIVFVLTRRFARDRWRRKFPDWWRTIDAGVRHRGIRYLILLRLAPIIPYAVVNPMMALTGMRVWTFFWVSGVGMFPGSAFYALAGAGVSFWVQG